jgi:XTP/dITP diphosphohydrolase
MKMMKVVLATQNRHKVKEILEIWGEVPFQVLTLDRFPEIGTIKEEKKTFRENALKKAREVARRTHLLTVSDDSGLEVDALKGAPGVFSARYAGGGATDRDNNEKLLRELRGVSLDSPGRKARFRCVAAIVGPEGFETTVEGSVEGRIIDEPRGRNGFGYDPLFLVPEEGRTTAEMSPQEKHTLSHRAQAFRRVREILIARFKAASFLKDS